MACFTPKEIDDYWAAREHNTGQYDQALEAIQKEADREVGTCWDCERENVKLYMKGLCSTCYVTDKY